MKLVIRSKVFYTIVFIFCILVVGAIAAAFYFYTQYAKIKQDPQIYTQAEAEKTVEAVSKLMVLPQDEQPTVATVSDPEQLRSQPFFAHAEQGDKVLIYANAQKAILYNPTENKIVEVAPIDLSNSDQSSQLHSTTQSSTGTSTKQTKK